MKRLQKFLIIFFIPFIIFFSSNNTCYSKDLIQNFKTGKINWTTGVVIAWGNGYASKEITDVRLARELAKKEAILDARRNLIKIIKSVRLDSKVSIEDIVKNWDITEDNIKRTTYDSKVKTDFLPDNRAKATVELKIYGKLADSVYFFSPEKEEKKSDKTMLSFSRGKSEETFERKKEKEFLTKESKTGKEESLYSGIIIDARNLEAEPALFPKIFNEREELIYSYTKVEYPYVMEQGMVKYERDLKNAQKDVRVKPRPLVIRAIGVRGEGKTDIVINDGDAKKLMNEEKTGGFLKQGKVVILLDK
ncbi:MAG: hypothetical protein A2W05_08415 [Candidatus Schekmanbacteria bacterium RBG_16_38_10]|uniref:LPP20 lipoprotein n=1 Tax=Candidatus Schekmanbacteria bacterium RBG_16_38_10 TaxID=1817879 RepID=A0A1F7S1V9_9BACT|nr:MAG: hypothetical protein A2W05_08415 [Candidatus Schekmanbacteria bacterium RBG_16_38_10]